MPVHSPHNDKELLQRVAAGDALGFKQLVHTYSGLLYSFVHRYIESPELAEELVQDIFTQVWLSRETLQEIENFRTYLFVLTRNHAVNALKKMLRERERMKEFNRRTELSTDEGTYTEHAYNLIEKAIAQLPAQQKLAWELSRRGSMTYQQIAAQMQVSRETVKTHIQLANAAITKYVTANMDLWLMAIFLEKIF